MNSPTRFLIIGDSRAVKELSSSLRMGYHQPEIISFAEGLPAIEFLEKDLPDMVLIDSPLIDLGTIEMVREIRTFSDVALIVIRKAKGDVSGVQALDAGADEFVTRPFTPREFLAKVRALLRRTHQSNSTSHVVFLGDELVINFDTCQAFQPSSKSG